MSAGSGLSFSIVWQKNRRAGWTTLIPICHEGQTYMFGYEAPTGKAKVWRLDSQGEGLTRTVNRPMQLDWTAFTTWSTPSGGKVLGYKIRNGLATSFALDSSRLYNVL